MIRLQVSLELTGGNKTFFFPGKPIQYKVNVSDQEDGSLENKRIAASKVKIVAAYQDAEDKPKTDLGHQEAPVTFTAGKTLIEKSDCKACHFQDKKSIGPAFIDVAAKYKADNGAVATLSDKIIKGGAGVWGETAMAAHPSIGLPEAGQMVKYILSLANEKTAAELLTAYRAKSWQGYRTVVIRIKVFINFWQATKTMVPTVCRRKRPKKP
jgi:cytochrome c